MQNINSVPAVPIVNMEPKKAETEQQQVSFQGTQHQAAQAKEKNTHPILKLITAGVVAVLAGAGHKTYSVNSALKEAGLKDSSKIKLSDIFLRNLNPVNWFSKADATKALTDIECTKIGDSGKLFKTKDGDTVLLDRSKVFKLKDGESEEVEAFTKKVKPADKAKPTDAASQTTRQTSHNINPQLIKDIKALPQEVTPENTQKLTNLILKDMGFNPEELGIIAREASEGELAGDACAQFNARTGEILLHKDLIDSGNTITNLAPTIAHELDHGKNFLKMCKSMGIDNYEKFVNGIPEASLKGKFNKNFWQKATQKIDATEFDHKPYVDGLKKQVNINENVGNAYFADKSFHLYMSNPLEKEGYATQHAFEDALQTTKESTLEAISEAFGKTDTALDEYISQHKVPQELKPKLYSYFHTKAIDEALTGKSEEEAIKIMNSLSDHNNRAKYVENMIPLMKNTPYNENILQDAHFLSINEIRSAFQAGRISEEHHAEALKVIDQNVNEFMELGHTQKLDPAKEMVALATKIHIVNKGEISGMALRMNGLDGIKVPSGIRDKMRQNSHFQEMVKQTQEANEGQGFKPKDIENAVIIGFLTDTKLKML